MAYSKKRFQALQYVTNKTKKNQKKLKKTLAFCLNNNYIYRHGKEK